MSPEQALERGQSLIVNDDSITIEKSVINKKMSFNEETKPDKEKEKEKEKKSKKNSKKVSKSIKVVEEEVVTIESRLEAIGVYMADDLKQYYFMKPLSHIVVRKLVKSGMIYHENKRIEDE